MPASVPAVISLATAMLPLATGPPRPHYLRHVAALTSPGSVRPVGGRHLAVRGVAFHRSRRHSAVHRSRRRLAIHRSAGVAHAAAAGGVVIRDFAFGPTSLTIHQGDAVTWSNQGPAAHTATATDHSFDTGTLTKGQSASHRFTSAGTFSYVCTIHPFMKATVVVLQASPGAQPSSSAPTTVSTSGRSGSSSAAPTPGASAATASTTQSTTPRPQLPVTGFDAIKAAVLGLIMLAGGVGLRRASRSAT